MNSLVGDPGELTNRFNPSFQQYFREADVQNPSTIFVFLDEHPDTINDGFFMNRLEEAPKWGNLPASHHQGSANLAFADGHVENHRWSHREPVPPCAPTSRAVPVASSRLSRRPIGTGSETTPRPAVRDPFSRPDSNRTKFLRFTD